MKGMDLFCVSPASTAICTGSDGRSMIRHGGRPIDRRSSHNHHHHHLPRPTQPHVPCSSQLMPIIPRPYCEKPRSSSSKKIASDARRKSSADIYGLKSPPGSSRFLLSDVAFADLISETSEPSDRNDLSALVPVGQPTVKPGRSVSSSESPSLRPSQSIRSHEQVVVLKVSLHCKGCESKLRKHLAKMEGRCPFPSLCGNCYLFVHENPPRQKKTDFMFVLLMGAGVTSFSIDMESKKVTVRGDITPLGILSSVSRVKYAQLWPSLGSSSALQSPSWSAWSMQWNLHYEESFCGFSCFLIPIGFPVWRKKYPVMMHVCITVIIRSMLKRMDTLYISCKLCYFQSSREWISRMLLNLRSQLLEFGRSMRMPYTTWWWWWWWSALCVDNIIVAAKTSHPPILH